jgi:ribonuclease Z
MLVSVQAGPYTVRGVSLGGVYTSLQVPELGVVFDAGIAHRAFAATDHLFLSHGHADHLGALFSLLGIRGLMAKPPPNLYFPAAIEAPLLEMLRVQSSMQRFPLDVVPHPMRPGDTAPLRPDLSARAFRTHHVVPSLGYELFRPTKKLKPELRELPGAEIARRRRAGEDLFEETEQLLLAYATDTLPRVLETHPSLLRARVLLLECTFLDERKKRDAARRGAHIHLDDLLELRPDFRNEALVLMHLSQLYRPSDVRRILDARLPPEWRAIVVPFVPREGRGDWPY